ncbi:MAG: hypothetical protein HY456_00835 [Parcubacteria group bacterium]|nr:hypothetical protein [Parcubacteria group bacterium]
MENHKEELAQKGLKTFQTVYIIIGLVIVAAIGVFLVRREKGEIVPLDAALFKGVEENLNGFSGDISFFEEQDSSFKEVDEYYDKQ